jgi:hypothetical protein
MNTSRSGTARARITRLAAMTAALCAWAAAGAAHAQSGSEPSACAANIVGGGDLNWGRLSHNALSPGGMTVLDPRPITLQVQCANGQKTHVAFWATDTNPQSAMAGTSVNGAPNGNDPARIFGLGVDPVTGQKIGNFTLVARHSTYGDTTNGSSFGYVNTLAHSATSFVAASFSGIGYGTNQEWTVLDSTGSPALASTFTFTFDVYPQLNTSKAISNAQEVPFSGAAQFYVRYF